MTEARLLRANLGKAYHQKLDEYLESVRNVEMRLARLQSWVDKPKHKLEFYRSAVGIGASTQDRDD